MSLKPWREIVQPHEDVLKGSFEEAEFAADITQVHENKAKEEYQNSIKFYSRTFITEGMRLLLESVAKRMSGIGGDPVIQLQTAFGGGKTHTMLAVYHMVKGDSPISELKGLSEVLDKAGITDMPKANIAVLDGTNLSVNKPLKRGDIKTHTLWGELAWQLGGESGYEIVKDADLSGTSPGKNQLIELLTQCSPSVILIDELVAYMRQLEDGKSYKGGTFDSNLSFMQSLTEGIKSVKNCILLASLPESDTEIGSTMGKRAQDALEKVFGRVNAVWKPVATEEAFEIVRRRLFEKIVDESALELTAKAFENLYSDNKENFPAEAANSNYINRIKRSYPIHPEIFDRLYNDWSTLDKFQRTRGVLQYLAEVIFRLWSDNNKDLLIMPGSIPLYNGNVRNKSIYYLPAGWDPVIEKDIDGERSETYEIDKDSRFGSVQAARRVARTIFLGSAPSVSGQLIRGTDIEHICLGVVQAGDNITIFKDVIKRLQDKLHYLNYADNRFWFDVRPNLRKEMEARKQRVDYNDEILPILKQNLQSVFRSGNFLNSIHIFAESVDVPDDSTLRIIILKPRSKFSKSNPSDAISDAKEILQNRGNQPRLRQNRLLFIAPDLDQTSLLIDHVKTFAAWKSIVDDVSNMKLNLDQLQANQAKKNFEGIKNSLQQSVRSAYKWVLAPFQTAKKGKGISELEWDNLSLSTIPGNIVQEIEHKIVDQEWVINSWSPLFFDRVLKEWFFDDTRKEINTRELLNSFNQYLYMPRLLNEDVLKETITKGIESTDFYAYAYGKEDDEYKGFKFGEYIIPVFDEESLLIELNHARVYQSRINEEIARKAAEEQARNIENQNNSSIKIDFIDKTNNTIHTPVDNETVSALKKRFFGNIELNPMLAKSAFQDIVDEVINQFTSNMKVNVKISVEIEATNTEGFDENLQRSVKENCNVLKFQSAEFEE